METRILVCDDEEAVREVVSVVLGMVGYLVESAVDGSEALQMIRKQPGRYQLLLTDHKMKDLDGLGLVRELRANGFSGKIVVLSGSLEDEDITAYTKLAVDGIILKPFEFGELRKTFGRILSPSVDGAYINSGHERSEMGSDERATATRHGHRG